MRQRGSLFRTLSNAIAAVLLCLAVLAATSTMQAQNTIYALTQSGVFGTLNLSTATFTQIGTNGVEPAGMAGLGGALYVAAYPTSTLYQVNVANGSLITLGNASFTYYESGGTTSQLYGVGTDQNLYSVNASNGASTLVGPTGLPSGGFQAMSGGGTGLYAVATLDTGTVLYSLNTTTGAATEVGNTGITNNVTSIGFYQGTLYGCDEEGNLYSINVNNAQVTLIGNSGQDIWGLGIPSVSLNVLHTFTGEADGGFPFAGMITDTAGNLYGTAGAGGTGSCSYFNTTGCGTIFELKKHNSAFVFEPLYSFQGGTDGEFPVRPMTLNNGTYYGATLGGGEGTCLYDGVPECGVVFNVGPSPTPQRTPLLKFIEHSIPYRFTGGSDGGEPFSTVVFDSSGNIYGTSMIGGAHNLGVVWKLTPNGNTYTESVIHNFAGGLDGQYPLDGLIFDSAGNLYGTTASGGSTTACMSNGCGTVFKLTPDGNNWTESVIYAFQGASDGENPNSGVAIDSAGNLYGNTWTGGAVGGGTVYELTPSGGGNYTFNLLYAVATTGGNAVGRVVLDSSGNVYEALQDGGAYGDGEVFELMHSGSNWNYIDLHDFTGGSDGNNAIGGVNFDASGNLYGTAAFGAGTGCGGGGCGVVWQIANP